MKNFCIFCGNRLIDGRCGCAEFISYYGAPAPAAPTPAPAYEPAPVAPVAPASAPESTPMDSHFQSAGDL